MQSVVHLCWLCFIIVRVNLKLDKVLVNLFIPIFYMALFGFLFSYQNDLRDALKDVWYLLKFILPIGIGWYLAKDLVKRDIISATVIGGFLYAAVHITKFFGYSIQGYESHVVRILAPSSLVTVLSVGFLISNRFFRRYLQMRRVSLVILLLPCLYSIWLSDSRTSYGVLFIIFVVLNGFYKLNVASLLVGCLSLGIIATTVSILEVDQGLEAGATESLESRFARSFDELIPSDMDNRDDASISFRGYEAFHALEEFRDGSVIEMLVGQGFGSKVDLGETWTLGGVHGEESGEVDFEELLIIHNGYLLVLVKYGLLGLSLYVYFIYSWISRSKLKKSASWTDEMFYRAVICIAVVFYLTTLLATGLLNKGGFTGVLGILGALMSSGHSEAQRQKKISNILV